MTTPATILANATLTCPRNPEQWEGTLPDGRRFYFRYRDGWASLGVGHTRDQAVDDSDNTGTGYGAAGELQAWDRPLIFGYLLAQALLRGTTTPTQ